MGTGMTTSHPEQSNGGSARAEAITVLLSRGCVVRGLTLTPPAPSSEKTTHGRHLRELRQPNARSQTQYTSPRTIVIRGTPAPASAACLGAPTHARGRARAVGARSVAHSCALIPRCGRG